MERKNALVPGASGIIGRTLIEHLSGLDDWNIVGLSRRQPESNTRAKYIEVDLLARADCEQKLGGLNEITHIFYAAYQPRPTPAEEVAPNKAMLVNVVEVSADCGSTALHIFLTRFLRHALTRSYPSPPL